jgi:hypothetical protein
MAGRDPQEKKAGKQRRNRKNTLFPWDLTRPGDV